MSFVQHGDNLSNMLKMTLSQLPNPEVLWSLIRHIYNLVNASVLHYYYLLHLYAAKLPMILDVLLVTKYFRTELSRWKSLLSLYWRVDTLVESEDGGPNLSDKRCGRSRYSTYCKNTNGIHEHKLLKNTINSNNT